MNMEPNLNKGVIVNILNEYGIRLTNRCLKKKFDLITNIARHKPLNETKSGKHLSLLSLELNVIEGSHCSVKVALSSAYKVDDDTMELDYERAREAVENWLTIYLGPVANVAGKPHVETKKVGNTPFKDCFH